MTSRGWLLLLALLMVAAPVDGTPRRTPAPADRGDECRKVIRDDGLVRPDGSRTSLAETANGAPLAIVVLKGHWCSVCTDQLESLTRRSREIRRTGGKVVGLSTEDAGTNRMLMDRHELNFPILSEPSARLLEQLGFWMPKMGHPMPGLIFLDHCGDFAGSHRGRRPGKSQDELILRTLRELGDRSYSCGPPS
ncbi:MAG: redoxin domain-containing protein [Myxococcota bacterium]|nr:redoxin domain-containing protein [Myxococcota bacterium]